MISVKAQEIPDVVRALVANLIGKRVTVYGDILGLFLAQFLSNVKTENFESNYLPQTEESLEQFYFTSLSSIRFKA